MNGMLQHQDLCEQEIQRHQREAQQWAEAGTLGRLASTFRHQRREHPSRTRFFAIAQAEVISFMHLGSHHCGRALLRLLLDDREGAAQDIEAAERIGVPSEAQVAWSHPLSVAMYGWDEDPRAATDGLLAWASEHVDGQASTYLLAVELARMALRLHDSTTLEAAARMTELHTAFRGIAPQQARSAWVQGIVAGDAGAVAAAASTLENLGLKSQASDAWADAALLAARAEIDSEAASRAAVLVEEMGIRPWLAPLPETRWRSEEASITSRC